MPSKIESLGSGKHQLVVDGEPYLMRPAELNNSSFSSAEYMSEVWPRLVDLNINTVLGSVSWEQIESEEGNYDFEELDKVLNGAREHGLKVVLLWFGAHKNGMSTYVPAWVKVDDDRFPRAMVGNPPQTHDLISLFDDRCVEADSKAFVQLMRHVEQFNKQETTVIMVQVENECGVRDDSRDRSVSANARYDSPVPKELTSKLRQDWANLNKRMHKTLVHWTANGYKQDGSWAQVFGEGEEIDELFMAYHYAKYVESVASAGRKETSLPMFVNAWQPSGESGVAGGGDRPGIYPSGGPVPSVLDIWHLFAPTIAFTSPDIYTTDYEQTCLEYSHRQQPFFIPEQRRDEYGAIRIWSAVGTYSAIGTSPFGIDTDPASPFKHHFNLLAKVSPAILTARREGRQIYGFFFDRFASGSKDPSTTRKVEFGDWILNISRAMVFGHPGPGYGLIIQLSKPSTFLLVGEGFQVEFSRHDNAFTSILSFTELDIVDGKVERLRMLNGDETSSHTTASVARMPGPDPDYGDFPIAISIPSRTRIAECVPYPLSNRNK